MFGSPYYNAQAGLERIDSQIKDLESMRAQLQKTQPAINQTFQLAPSTTGVKIVDNIDEVKRELVFADSAFFNKDLSVMWLKNTKGEIKTFTLTEVIEKDEKDKIIDALREEIETLRGGRDEKPVIAVATKPSED